MNNFPRTQAPDKAEKSQEQIERIDQFHADVADELGMYAPLGVYLVCDSGKTPSNGQTGTLSIAAEFADQQPSGSSVFMKQAYDYFRRVSDAAHQHVRRTAVARTHVHRRVCRLLTVLFLAACKAHHRVLRRPRRQVLPRPLQKPRLRHNHCQHEPSCS